LGLPTDSAKLIQLLPSLDLKPYRNEGVAIDVAR